MVVDDPKKTRALYDAVSKDYSIGSYEEFDKKLQDPTKRKSFYDGVGKEYNLGSFSDFEAKVVAQPKQSANNPFNSQSQEEFIGKENATRIKKEVANTKVNNPFKNIKPQDFKKSVEQGMRNEISNYDAVTMRERENQALQEDEFWKTANQEDIGVQLKNSAKNIWTGLQKVVPQVQLASTDIWEGILGKELAKDAYQTFNGEDIGQKRLSAYKELADLDSQMLKTTGSVSDNIRYLNAQGLVVNLADAVGNLVSTGVPAVITAGGATIPSMVGQSIADFNNEKAKSKGISVEELYKTGQAELKTPLLIGAIGGSLELVGIKAVGKLASGSIKGAGAKKMALYALEVNKEGLTELLQNGLEEVNKVKANGGSDEDAVDSFVDAITSKKGLDSYLMGVFGAGGAGAMGHITSTITNYETKKAVETNITRLGEIQKDLENQNIPPETKQLLEKEAKKVISQTATEIDKADNLVEKLTDEDKVKSEKLNVEKEQVEVSLQEPNLSEVGKEVLTKQLEKIDTQLEEIKPQKVEPQVAVEAQPTEYFNEYEKAVKESTTPQEALAKSTGLTESGVLSYTFNKKYNPDGTLTQEQAFEKFYNEIKPTEVATPEVIVAPEQLPTVEVIPTVEQESEVSGIKKDLVSQEKVDNVDFEKITDEEMQGLGKGLVESGEIKPKDIVTEISGGNRRALQPKEVVSLIYYKATLDNQYRELLKQKNEKLAKGETTPVEDKAIAKIEQDINDFDTTSIITAQQQSLAFRLRKGLLDKDYNYVTQVEKYKAANKGVISPDVEAKFKEYDRELKKLKEEIAVAEERARVAEENQAVNNISEDVKRGQKAEATKRKRAEANLTKVKEEFNRFVRKSRGQVNSFADVAEFVKQASKLVKAYAELGIVKIEEVIAEMRKDYGDKFVDDNVDNITEAYNTVNADRTKPFISNGELTVPSSYIRGLVENGVTDINELSQAVLDEVKNDLPDATLRQVRDAITRYGKSVNPTRNEVTEQINKAKSLGRLYSKLEDVQNGIRSVRSVIRRTPLTEEEKQLKRQIKEIEDTLPQTDEEIQRKDENRLNARKRYVENFIKDRQERLQTGNFAPKAKPSPLLADTELDNLQAKANEIRNKYEEAHYENEQSNRSLGKKAWDELIEWGTGLTRALQAGLDLSAFGVQLALYTSTTAPSKVLNTLKESFRFMGSENYQKQFFAKLQTHPYYNVMKSSGLALAYPNSKLGSVDYQLSGSSLNKIWNNGIVYPLKFVNENAYETAKRVNPYRATERAFTGAIDTARMQMFMEFVNDLENQGITFENNPAEYKRAAEAVNNLTFRGNLQSLEPTSKYLALIFFAPRKIKATFELTNPYYYVNTALQSPTVAKRLIWKMATFIGVATAVTLGSKYALDDDEEDTNPDVFNPYSSDFMKLRLGYTRINMFGGLDQNLVFFARQITKNYKRTSTSQMDELGSSIFIPTRWELGENYLYNKFAPTPSLIRKIANEKKGQEIDWDSQAVETVTPLWTSAINELYKEHPKEMATFLTFMALIGQSMNTYGTAEFLDKEKDKKIIDLIRIKGGSFRNKTMASIEVIDEGSGKKRGISSEEYKIYKNSYGEFVKEEMSSRYKELYDMPVLKFEKELLKIKRSATDIAEYNVSKVDESVTKLERTVKGESIRYDLTPEQIKLREGFNQEYIDSHQNVLEIYTKRFVEKEKLSKSQAKLRAKKDLEKLANRFSKNKMFSLANKGEIKLTEKP